MIISKIISIDIDAKEADVIVTDGKFEVLCFYWGITIPYLNMTVNTPLTTLYPERIVVSTEKECGFEKINAGYYAYNIRGKLKNIANGVVCVGDIEICIGNSIPKDISIGTIIEFKTERLDI